MRGATASRTWTWTRGGAVAALLALVLGVGSLVVHLGRTARREHLAHAVAVAKASTDLQQALLAQWMALHVELAIGLAADAGDDTPLDLGSAGPWLEAQASRHRFNGAAVVSESGAVLVRTRSPLLELGEDARGAARVAAAGRSTTALQGETETAPPRLWVAVPMRSGLALLVVIDAGEYLRGVLARTPLTAHTAEAHLVRREGDLVAFAVAPPKETARPFRVPVRDEQLPAVQAALRSGGRLQGRFRGNDVVGFARALEKTPWVIFTRIDAAEPLAEAARDRAVQAGLLAAVLLLAAALGAWRWQLSRARSLALRLAAEERAHATAQALAAAQERLDAVLQATGTAVWAFDLARGVLDLVGGEAVLGGDAAALRDPAALWRLVHPADAPEVRQRFDAHVAGGAALESTHRMLRADGGWRWVHARGATVARDAGGRPVRVAGTMVDVTDRVQQAERLQLAERMASVGTLAAGVAHEINNPLAYVVANLAWIDEALAGDAPALADVRTAAHEAKEGALRVRDIVRDLRALARAGDDRAGPVALRPVLESALNVARNELRQRARVVLALDHVGEILGDATRLGQVCLNLIVNAAQAIPEGAPDRHTVRVSLTEAGAGRVRLAVADTGSGIRAEDLPRVFDPFFTTKPVGQGTGLGLAICHQIVTAAGGTIGIDSLPGRGTVVTVLLPRAAGAPRRAPPPPARPIARRRVLVVDDEPLVLATVRRVLGAHHDVTTFAAPDDALAALRGGASFDVALLDLVMPGKSGLALHAAIADVAPSLAAATLLLTGGAFTPETTAALAGCRLPRVDKPFTADQLLAAVAAMARAEV